MSLQETISQLKAGDRIVTTGGVIGTITTVRDTSFLIRSADKSILEIARSAVAGSTKKKRRANSYPLKFCHEETEPAATHHNYRGRYPGKPLFGYRTSPQTDACDFTWSGIKTNLRSNIRLGLDLKGGSHLVMRVKTDDFLKSLTEGNALAAENAAKDAGSPVKESRAETVGQYRVVLEATDSSKLNEIEEAVKKKVDLSEWAVSKSGSTIAWDLTPTSQRALAEQATEQAHKIILSRLEGVGVASRWCSDTARKTLIRFWSRCLVLRIPSA